MRSLSKENTLSYEFRFLIYDLALSLIHHLSAFSVGLAEIYGALFILSCFVPCFASQFISDLYYKACTIRDIFVNKLNQVIHFLSRKRMKLIAIRHRLSIYDYSHCFFYQKTALIFLNVICNNIFFSEFLHIFFQF